MSNQNQTAARYISAYLSNLGGREGLDEAIGSFLYDALTSKEQEPLFDLTLGEGKQKVKTSDVLTILKDEIKIKFTNQDIQEAKTLAKNQLDEPGSHII